MPSRIQHNITSLNAYRNYYNNNRALSANLEKLSSGYKINRAGDDAAGLAISEKMRAQITGLNVAQKNAKDGISLVQTAEGALTEVHDMLNRMYSLAEQSANGTYDNDVDRAQLQKEVDSLKTEIDRISDSANFNGIKLLDGSLTKREAGLENVDIRGVDRILKSVIQEGDKAYEVAGLKTITETTEGEPTRASFKIDLTTVKWSVNAAEATTTGTGVLAEAITIKIGDSYVSTANATGTNRIKLHAHENASGQVIATDITAGSVARAVLSSLRALSETGTKARVTINGVEWNVKATAGVTGSASGALVFTQVRVADTADQARANFDVSLMFGSPDDKISFNVQRSLNAVTEVLTAGVANGGGAFANTVFQMNEDDIFDGAVIRVGDATIKLKVGADSKTNQGAASVLVDLSDMEEGKINLNKALSRISETVSYASASKINGSTGIAGSKGNRYIKYKYTYVKASTGRATTAYARFKLGVNDNSQTKTVGLGIQRIDDLKANGVSTATTSQMIFLTRDKVGELFGLKGTRNVTAQSGLTLQIGDTPDEFNQLNISLKDCHVQAMGLSGIDISTQEGANEALSKIKDAINYVSDVRGTLGATQNRLDHTINNLSVMSVNIQDAESTIRDTDVAEMMMSFTKNSIMVQAAQAMLAQANQLPQGVLQLLG